MVVAAALPLWAGTKNGTGSFSQAASSTSPKSILMPGECFVAIPQGQDDAEASELTNQALQELLLGDQEQAFRLLTQAIDLAPNSLLPHAALLATGLLSDATAQQEHVDHIRHLITLNPMLTPAEETAMAWLLDLARGEHNEALKKIQAHTQRYRNDVYTRCWEILLLHYAGPGYDLLGNASPDQQQAEQQAATLFSQKPDNGLSCFVRALVEEGRPTVTAEACEAAKRAAGFLPHHPIAQQLCAHMLYRAGHYENVGHYLQLAQQCLDQREQAREGESSRSLSAEHSIQLRLYEATLYSTLRMEKKALALRRSLNAIPLLTGENAARADQILLRWEAHTLPLRILFLPGVKLTSSWIKAASRAATVPDNCTISPNEQHALHSVRDCLEASLNAILFAKSKQYSKAQQHLQRAESFAKQLQEQAPAAASSHPSLKRYLTRQLEACTIAINLGKKAIHPEQADTWNAAIRDATRPPSVMLPPVIPPVCADSKPS